MTTVTQPKRQETAIDVPRMVIVMKNSLTFWVTKETGERAQAHLEKQTAHSFMRIAELGETINTAEIAGVHSPSVYEELKRVETGEYKCQWGRWHGKKQVCECKAEADREHRRKMKEAEDAKDNLPETPEMRERRLESFRKSDEMAALDKPDSIFGQRYHKGARSGKMVRRSTILDWQERNPGAEVPEILTIDEDII
jgi:hypothetical protein